MWKYAAAIVALEYLAALTIGAVNGFHYRLPADSFIITSLTFLFAVFVSILLFHLARWAIASEEHPIARLRTIRWPWDLAIGTILVALQIAVLGWTKVMMPKVVGFTADPRLAQIDAAIFGTDPWRLLHQVTIPWIDPIYISWSSVKFATLIILFLSPRTERRDALILAYFPIIATGALGQYLVPSAGPIFYEWVGHGNRFADLPVAPWVEITRRYLWADYLRGGGSVGGGISAFPSIHVAVALWVALVVRALLPRFQLIGWAYFMAILIGSVYLGWHYAADGVASCIITLLVVGLSDRLLRSRRTISFYPA